LEKRLKIGKKGVIVIPRKMRSEVGLTEGSEVKAQLLPSGILLRPRSSKPVEELTNLIKKDQRVTASSTKTIRELRKSIDRELETNASVH
jgi:AbrB family looped-hinge helix DNA binding protein